MAKSNPLAARLRNKIVIQEYTDTIDAAGGPTGTWTSFITRFAAVVPLNGNEYFTAQQLGVDVNVRIRMRYDSLSQTITPKHRVLWGVRTFDIKTVINPQERNKEIVLMCEESL